MRIAKVRLHKCDLAYVGLCSLTHGLMGNPIHHGWVAITDIKIYIYIYIYFRPWYSLGLSILTCNPTHLPKPANLVWNPPDQSPTVNFHFQKTKSNKSVDKSSHEKPSIIDLTGLLLSPDTNPARSSQISTRSVKIWPDFDEIHRNSARFWWDPSRSGKISTRSFEI